MEGGGWRSPDSVQRLHVERGPGSQARALSPDEGEAGIGAPGAGSQRGQWQVVCFGSAFRSTAVVWLQHSKT